MSRTFHLPELGLTAVFGKFARQAHGAVWLELKGTRVLSTAVASSQPRDFPGFFPLTVEYRERMSAAGKIPGGYPKREGKLSDFEVLTSRLIDRPIRPLFPTHYFREVQLLTTVYSSDGAFPTSILSIIGSSLALMVSDIPFLGPIGAVQISRVNGEWIFNPSYEQSNASDTDITVAGTEFGISMVEGHCNNLVEAELVDLLLQAHELIKQQILWQKNICQELNIIKHDSTNDLPVQWDLWEKRIMAIVNVAALDPLFTANTKEARSQAMSALQLLVTEKYAQEIADENISSSIISYLFDLVVKKVLPDVVAQKNKRIDGRSLTEVRPISVEVGLLPAVHGSCLFTRGETQALASITLGTNQDAQKIDTLLGGTIERSFMLHYNFPPFSTGEVRPMRAVSRRDIGHGYLAESSFLNTLPSPTDFPYTMRSLVDILESNGSSSMATVCATTMAFMDCGVPIKEMISGTAMGLLRDSAGNFYVLTDILGSEDAFGLMDFKVTGTDRGIMAFQLDVKDNVGLNREVLVKALAQARDARIHILNEMKKALSAPRSEISPLAPRIFMFKIPQDKIGMIIGPGGKNIKEIVATTQTQVDIEDDGTVKVYSRDSKTAQHAEAWIKTLAGFIEPGATYQGTVKRIVDFGIFVELVPGKEGLIHISAIAKSKQKTLDQFVKQNAPLEVKVVSYDNETGRIRLVAPSLEH